MRIKICKGRHEWVSMRNKEAKVRLERVLQRLRSWCGDLAHCLFGITRPSPNFKTNRLSSSCGFSLNIAVFVIEY